VLTFHLAALFRQASHHGMLSCVLLLVGLWSAGMAHAGVTYRFGGGAIAGCSLSGKVYTCANATLPNYDDKVIIDNGYTVNVQSDVAFGWNQGLTMSGTARLTSTGNLNLAGLNPPNLVVSGGSFGASGKFSIIGANQIKADITAGSMSLGDGPTLQITGAIVSRGEVAIAYSSVINGAVSGTVITAGASVTIKGDVNASSRFVLDSAGNISGNVVAPEVELLASNTVIGGNVTATKFLNMAQGMVIKGSVDTGQLTMREANAVIEGVARVDFANMYYGAKVNQVIVCKNGTKAGQCDCVNNQTGSPVNSTGGPRCESPKATSALHHFLITHDGSGQTCADETVSVTACANAACSAPHFTGGARVTLQPGGVVTTIGSSGVGSGEVSRSSAGTEALKLTYTGSTGATTCRNSAGGSASCDMTFSGGVAFDIDVPDHRAGENASAVIKALQSDPKTSQCVAAFKNADKPIQYSCGYETTSKDTAGLALADAATSAKATLVCRSGAKQAVNTRFDANGAAKLTLNYQDVGKLKLMAQLDDAKGDATFIVAPHRFGISNLPKAAAGEALRAGDDFKVTVSALNANGAITPSFDKTALQPDMLTTELSVACVPKGDAGSVGVTVATSFASGSASPTLWWSEVGTFDLKIGLADFLGSSLGVTGSTKIAEDRCPGNVGPFIPKYFTADQSPLEVLKGRSFYYAGEPVPVRISAMNARGAVTKNYDGVLKYSAAVALAAYGEIAGKLVLNPSDGVLSQAGVNADSFSAGVAPAAPSYASGIAAPIAPTVIQLRATTAAKDTPGVTSDDGKGSFEKARPKILSGRLRVGSNAGRVGDEVALEIAVDYWSGRSWLLNAEDSFTRIPVEAFAQSAVAKAGASLAPAANKLPQSVIIKAGKADPRLIMVGNQPGWIDLAVNLGTGGQDIACQGSHPPNKGASLPWLRLPKGCRDPAGRATFGELAPENRRIIHVREVFN